jgi:hypothetical protein
MAKKNSLPLRGKKHKLKIFENKVLRKKFLLKN